MLSILIPTYNYNIYDLVLDLHNKCLKEHINFEIICLEDGSNTTFINLNKKINKLSNCQHIINPNNSGRILTRLKLANLAKYDWLLYLDADVFPKSNDFILNYLQHINTNSEAVFGGFAYQKDTKNKTSLRYLYGKKYEQVNADIRNKTPYKIIISANFLIKKALYLSITKQFKTTSYGADLIFATHLMQHKVNVHHINNEVYHLGLEDNIVFFNKQKEAVSLLHHLNNQNKLITHQNSLLKAYKLVKKYRLEHLYLFLFKRFEPTLQRLIVGASPKTKLLQFYKLGYFISLQQTR